jgi:hypothetical protein
VDHPLDHDRLPVVTVARRGRAWVFAGPLAAAVVAGCSADPAPTGPPAPLRTIATTGSAPEPALAASPLPADVVPADVQLDTETLVCESWGSEPPVGAIQCRGAASLALAAMGPEQAARVERLDVGFGDRCGTGPCPDRRPDVGWVLARFATGAVRLIHVATDPAGGLRVWPPVMGEAPAPVAFRPPARTAPDLGPDAPSALRDREPYPFCGREDIGSVESYDVVARRCFVDGVLAGSPVELLSQSVSTEGDAVLTVYRFGGRGSVVRSVRAGGAWTSAVCAISPIATPAAFAIAGGCDERNP